MGELLRYGIVFVVGVTLGALVVSWAACAGEADDAADAARRRLQKL